MAHLHVEITNDAMVWLKAQARIDRALLHDGSGISGVVRRILWAARQRKALDDPMQEKGENNVTEES